MHLIYLLSTRTLRFVCESDVWTHLKCKKSHCWTFGSTNGVSLEPACNTSSRAANKANSDAGLKLNLQPELIKTLQTTFGNWTRQEFAASLKKCRISAALVKSEMWDTSLKSRSCLAYWGWISLTGRGTRKCVCAPVGEDPRTLMSCQSLSAYLLREERDDLSTDSTESLHDLRLQENTHVHALD